MRFGKVVNLYVAWFLLLTLPGITATAQDTPNIVFILADDLGFSDLACYGNPYNETPHIDSLALRGIRFSQAYAPSPVCSPTRAALLTGKHPARLRLTNFLGGERVDPDASILPADWQRYLSPRETTLAEMLTARQYATGFVGKWHLGGADSLLPSAQGFLYERMIARNGLDYYNYTITDRHKTVFEDKGQHYLTDKLTEYGVEFIRENRSKPFFLYLAYSAPHVMLVPRADKLRKYYFKYNKHDGRYNPVYAAMLESLDDGVGKIVATLRELKLEKNTIVIFTSDNGGVGLDELGPVPTSMKPLRAWKGHVYEGGIRVPFIVRWPAKVKQNFLSPNVISLLDVYATFAEILQTPVASDDGKSMLQGWTHPEKNINRGDLFWHYPHFSNQLGRPSGAIRSGDLKLVEHYESGKVELFDLSNDISESKDLATEQPLQSKRLLQALQAWRSKTGAQMPVRRDSKK